MEFRYAIMRAMVMTIFNTSDDSALTFITRAAERIETELARPEWNA